MMIIWCIQEYDEFNSNIYLKTLQLTSQLAKSEDVFWST